MSVSYLCAVVAAVLDDSLHLLVDELHAAQAGLLQAFDLFLHQQLEGHLRHEQGGTGPLAEGGSGRSNQVVFWLNCRKALTELTVAFLMAVRMSMVLRPPRGSTDSSVRPNVSWKM